jgi:hypothetical protein
MKFAVSSLHIVNLPLYLFTFFPPSLRMLLLDIASGTE